MNIQPTSTRMETADFSSCSINYHQTFNPCASTQSTLSIGPTTNSDQTEANASFFYKLGAYIAIPFIYIYQKISCLCEKFLDIILWRSKKITAEETLTKPSSEAPFETLLASLEQIKNDSDVLLKWKKVWEDTPQSVKEALFKADGLCLAERTLKKNQKANHAGLPLTEKEIEEWLSNHLDIYTEASKNLFENLNDGSNNIQQAILAVTLAIKGKINTLSS